MGTKVENGTFGDDVKLASSRLAAVAGTSTCHLAISADPIFVPGVWGPYRDIVIPGSWMIEGGQSATGELIRYTIDSHPASIEAKASARKQGQSIYDFLNSRLEKMATDKSAPGIACLASYFFFYGDLWGNRSPVADPRMTGAIIGLTSDTSIDNLALHYYGAMEFIALQTKQIAQSMGARGQNITSIVMSGSQCLNKVLMKLIATACDMPVIIPHYQQAAVCHGAAMLGAKAASAMTGGPTKDLWAIIRQMSKPGTQIDPTEHGWERKLLRAKYEVFLDMCAKQQEYRAIVDRVLV